MGSQAWDYKFTAIFCICVIAFVVNYPLNVILSFDNAMHEAVIITNKDESHARRHRTYSLYVEQEDGVKEYKVSNGQYKKTAIGDQKKLHIQTSALGLKYYQLHD